MAVADLTIGLGDWAKSLLLVCLIAGCIYLWVRWKRWRLERAMDTRNQRRWTVEQSWYANRWPLTHRDVYTTEREFTEDLARLKAMGFSVEGQEQTQYGIAVTYSLRPTYKRGAQPEDGEAPAVPDVPYRPSQDHHEPPGGPSATGGGRRANLQTRTTLRETARVHLSA